MLMIRNLSYSLSIKVAIGGGVAICTPKHAHALKIKSLEIQPFCFDVIMTLLLRRVSDGQLVLRLKCSEKYANIMAADILTPRRQTINSHIIGNWMWDKRNPGVHGEAFPVLHAPSRCCETTNTEIVVACFLNKTQWDKDGSWPSLVDIREQLLATGNHFWYFKRQSCSAQPVTTIITSSPYIKIITVKPLV